MENASKALIIAGAILLAIVIISLGLIVVNNVRDTVDSTNLSEQEIQAFNAKFTAYESSNVSGSRVNTLIQQVIATNQATASEGGNHFVTIAYQPSSFNSAYLYITGSTDGTIKCQYITQSTSGGVFTNDAPISGDDSKITNDFSTYKAGSGVKPTSSVDTGKTYNVTIYYKNGLVKCITAIKNS